MERINWIYATSNEKPNEDEYVLCDLGVKYNFAVMKYYKSIFYDENEDEIYHLGEVKRWAHIGKHCDEQF